MEKAHTKRVNIHEKKGMTGIQKKDQSKYPLID